MPTTVRSTRAEHTPLAHHVTLRLARTTEANIFPVMLQRFKEQLQLPFCLLSGLTVKTPSASLLTGHIDVISGGKRYLEKYI